MGVNKEEVIELGLPFLPQLKSLHRVEVTPISARQPPQAAKCIPSKLDAAYGKVIEHVPFPCSRCKSNPQMIRYFIIAFRSSS